jgi:hypothetical protein
MAETKGSTCRKVKRSVDELFEYKQSQQCLELGCEFDRLNTEKRNNIEQKNTGCVVCGHQQSKNI